MTSRKAPKCQPTRFSGFFRPIRPDRKLSDFRSDGKAGGKEEIFNQCHARLRNAIERAFGVVKSYFPILKRMTPYSFTTQNKNCYDMLLRSQFSSTNLMLYSLILFYHFDTRDDQLIKSLTHGNVRTPSFSKQVMLVI
ncbi:unnamed protein product, partial [Vitis vinifera]